MLKRGYNGTRHKLSAKHWARYLREHAGHHNNRTLDTVGRMSLVTDSLHSKRPLYKDLASDNGCASRARAA